ncbi:NACHT domain-containing protein [Actinoplanes sp. L3-i22]|uniref:NACHT domain-containing protein n=1 Tax=Actinoplanes sp. L3-i22 TaxID=2836373 RepID=UPI001C78C2FC|nr:NACHT domain-containing protein [Actinoplanes sp. L3-i22]BCY11740.1 hypothetical protein L3i22_068280 [Actinoplanes sp. L3-i22]
MSITPLLALGLPLVRILLRLQEPSASDLADSIKDFDELLTSVKDDGDRREIGRNLEHISDRVVKRLAQFIQVEFRNVSEGDVAASAQVVSQALAQAGTADLTTVVRSDVQVRALEQHTLAHSEFREQATQLGGDADRLAYALLRESCYEVVDLARRHPSLTATALTSLLTRSNEMRELLDSVERSLNDLPARIADRDGEDRRSDRQREVDEFTVDYRRAVANDYDRLDLYGVDLIRDLRRYSLTTAYLSLRLEVPSWHTATTGPSDLAKILPKHGLAILRGSAGAGKTTILQWLATNVARQTLVGDLEHLNGHMPFVVKLRNYADSPFPRIEELAAVTTRSNLAAEPRAWSAESFQEGEALLLVDGLDELPRNRQRDLIDWLEGFQRFRRRILVVVTSRPTAWTSLGELKRLRFGKVAVADVLPLDREQIRSFVLHWHTAIASQMTGAERSAIEGQAAKVAGIVSNAREYRLLASSPLLCAVLCALFHLKRGVLPANRIEIYDTLLNLLLGERDAHKRVEVDEVRLTPTEKRLVLEDVADFLLTNGLSEAPMRRVEEVIARSPLAHRFGDATATDILQHLLARSGVLRAPSEKRIDFVHRTFLEYLAARSLVRHDRIEMLAAHVLQANWNEAVVLAAGIGIDRQVAALVEAVLTMVESATDDWRNNRRILTATCAGFLDTATILPQSSRSRILSAIAGVVPPTDEQDARACASAGNSVLPYLRSALARPDLPDPVLRMSIRTLGEIGTPEALAVLGSMAAERRIEAIESLVTVWSWFDPEAFANMVLRDLAPPEPQNIVLRSSTLLPHLRGLHENFVWACDVEVPEESFVDNCRSTPIRSLSAGNLNILHDPRAKAGGFLWTMPNLHSAYLGGLRNLGGMAGGITQLQILGVNSTFCRISPDLWPSLPHLTNLELSGEFDCDLRGVEATRLSTLWVDGMIYTPKKIIFGLPHLKSLHWHRADNMDLLIHILNAAPHLENLIISNVSALSTLSALTNAPQLKKIELGDLNRLANIDELLTMTKLSIVKITGKHQLAWSDDLERLARRGIELTIEGFDLEIAMAMTDDTRSS